MSQPPQGVKIRAYIFFAQAALTLLATCALGVLAGLAVTDSGAAENMIGMVVGFCIVLVFTVLYAGVGYSLLKMQPWSRIAAIVLAILCLCSFPIGTILGGVVLSFMFQPENIEAFS